MNRHRFAHAPFLLAALLAACAQPSLQTIEAEAWREQPSEDVLTLSEADLALVGERLAARRRHAPLRVADPRLEQTIRAVACQLDAPRCPHFEVQLWQSPLPAVAAWPNGLIELSTGALLRVVDEGELAALLAHALAHDRSDHRLRAVQAAQRALLPQTTRIGMVERPEPIAVGSPFALPTYAGSAVAGYWRVVGTTAGAMLSAVAMPPLLLAVPFVPIGVLGKGATAWPMMIDVDLEIALLPFAPALEIEAEREATRLLEKAGFDAGARGPLWQRLAHERSATVQPPDWRPFSQVHPVEPGSLDAQLGAGPLRAPLSARRAGGWAGVRAGHRLLWLVQEIGRGNWSSSRALIEDLLAYEPMATDLLWARAELLRRGDPPELERARTSLEQLVRQSDAPALAWRSLALVYDREGRQSAAAAAYRDYLARAPAAPERALLEYRLATGSWPFTVPTPAPESPKTGPRLATQKASPLARGLALSGKQFDAWSLFGKRADVTVLVKGVPPGVPLAQKDTPVVDLGMFPAPAPHSLPSGANPLEIVDLIGVLLSGGGGDLVELLSVAPDEFANGTAVRAEWRLREHNVGIEQRAFALLRVVDGQLVGVLFRAATFGPYALLMPDVRALIASVHIRP